MRSLCFELLKVFFDDCFKLSGTTFYNFAPDLENEELCISLGSLECIT